jgi:hypothetical protein
MTIVGALRRRVEKCIQQKLWILVVVVFGPYLRDLKIVYIDPKSCNVLP